MGDMSQQQHAQQMQQQQAQSHLRLPQIDLSGFDSIQGEDRKNFVGNSIYPAIQAVYGDKIAGIITGMLLDEGAVDQRQLLSDNAFFVNKVQEAHNIYSAHVQTQQPAAQ